jgi:hypothetical protein
VRIRNVLITGLTAVAIGASSIVYGITGASASIPAPAKGNITVLAQGPRLVPSPGRSITGGETQTVKVAGETFQGVTIPASATGVVLSVSNNQSAGAGQLRVYTTDAGQPGTPTISWDNGRISTASITVGLNDTGKLNVHSTTATRYLAAIVGYVTPLESPAAPVIKTIEPSAKTLEHVGPSVRTDNTTPGSGVTDFGKVTLAAGTYDVNVIGGFTGLKRTADIPDTTSLRGGLFLTKGAGIPAGFGNVLSQNQGVDILKTNSGSDTFTIDPTIQLNYKLVLTESTEVHVSLYAYSSDGVDRSALNVGGNIRSAQFTKIS